jgi:RNase P subunit RPR2
MSVETKRRGMNRGTPVAMEATCENCGYVSRGGTVMPWIEVHDGGPEWSVRDDVSFRCRECEETHHFDVEVTEVQ